MSKKVLLVLALGLTACGAAPSASVDVVSAAVTSGPATFAIDPTMPAAQAEVVRDVARAWCESDYAFCMTEVAWTWGAARVYWAGDYAQYNRQVDSCAFTVHGDSTVRIDADRAECFEDLHTFWLVVAHEFGHLDGFSHDSGLALMAPELDHRDAPLEIR